jgi:hypothetical protein
MIKIKPSSKNTNKHTVKGMELLEQSIDAYGVLESISVADDGTIISGHARKELFDKKGMIAKEIELADNEFAVIKTNIKSDSKEYIEAQIMANTTAHKNFNLDVELLAEVSEEFDLDIEELGVDVVELDGEDIQGLKKLPDGEAKDPFNDDGIDAKNQYGVIVICESAGTQESVFNDLTGMGFNCKIVVT